ncbi:carbohydrate kinase [Gloeopeniophorella convolvens]|nr:carbohydrate kinase [Gloeopeniophorella convolvens]
MAQHGSLSHIAQGVSGSGKSTLGASLAEALGLPFIDADDLHPAANKDKMARGEPLTDADRAPWLVRVRGAALETAEHDARGAVVACSALKAAYRSVLRGEGGALDQPDERTPATEEVAEAAAPAHALRTFFVHPFGPHDVLLERMTARKSHFMKANMLTSQLATLEDPAGEPGVVPVTLEQSPEEQLRAAVDGLRALGAIEAQRVHS